MLDLRALTEEKDVTKIVKAHFDKRNFQVEPEATGFIAPLYSKDLPPIDLDCINNQIKQRWIVEVKAETKDNADRAQRFQTGLYQLIYRMRPATDFPDWTIFYALASPGTKSYEERCRKMPPWPREQLHFHWLLIQEDSSIKLYCPPGCLCQAIWGKAGLATVRITGDEYIWS